MPSLSRQVKANPSLELVMHFRRRGSGAEGGLLIADEECVVMPMSVPAPVRAARTTFPLLSFRFSTLADVDAATPRTINPFTAGAGRAVVAFLSFDINCPFAALEFLLGHFLSEG